MRVRLELVDMPILGTRSVYLTLYTKNPGVRITTTGEGKADTACLRWFGVFGLRLDTEIRGRRFFWSSVKGQKVETCSTYSARR